MIVLNLIFNVLSFIEGNQTGTFDCADMHEHIFAAACRLNEPVTLRWIEPLHSPVSYAGLLVKSNRNRVGRSMGNSKLPPWGV